MMNADELGALRVIVPHLDGKHGGVLRFRCMSCERLATREVETIDLSYNGVFPLIAFSVAAGDRATFAVVLPFELAKWGGHLLHDVRAEWNGYWLSSQPIGVQELGAQTLGAARRVQVQSRGTGRS